LATALTKRLDASWAAGTNQGGLDTGAKGASTWYHIYLIRKDADGTIDVLFTATFGSPTMPAGYSNKRHIGSVKTNASSNIRPFLQTGNIVRWNDSTLTLDVDVTNLGTGSTSYTLAFIPTGLKVRALLHGYNWINADSRNILVRDPDTVDVAPSASVWPIANLAGPAASAVGYGELRIVTNTSAQVAARSSGANTYFRLAVMGWEYLRQV
jgi:hypothetical protein